MSEIFNKYAGYYDLLYKDKDYAAEAAYVDGLIRKHHPRAGSVLNLGCGTGKHDALLEALGHKVAGVDLSDAMLFEAKKLTIPGKLEFFKGDARSVDLGKKFGAVTSLFHVMSYQTSNHDILAAFKTAGRHLTPGGVFIFDFWSGPGVLSDPPGTRVKRLEDAAFKIIRVAEPVMRCSRNVVEVNYHIVALDKASGSCAELDETHSMRYYFLPELEYYLSDAGFSLKSSYGWMSEKELSSEWYGVVVAAKL